jgi:hypothetical protein
MLNIIKFGVVFVNAFLGIGQGMPEGVGIIIQGGDLGFMNDWFEYMVVGTNTAIVEVVWNGRIMAPLAGVLAIPIVTVVGSINGGPVWDPLTPADKIRWDSFYPDHWVYNNSYDIPQEDIPIYDQEEKDNLIHFLNGEYSFNPYPSLFNTGSFMARCSPYFAERFHELYISVGNVGWHIDGSAVGALLLWFPLTWFAQYLGGDDTQLHNVNQNGFLWIAGVLLVEGFKYFGPWENGFKLPTNPSPGQEILEQQDLGRTLNLKKILHDIVFQTERPTGETINWYGTEDLVLKRPLPDVLLNHPHWHPSPTQEMLNHPDFPHDYIQKHNWIGRKILPYEPRALADAVLAPYNWF